MKDHPESPDQEAKSGEKYHFTVPVEHDEPIRLPQPEKEQKKSAPSTTSEEKPEPILKPEPEVKPE